MIRRLYVHNFRCLENFELSIADRSSILLIGRNGTGKTTVMRALRILQQIARGANRVDSLVQPKDFARGAKGQPMRFEVEVKLNGFLFLYSIAFDLPSGFKELRIADERLLQNGQPIFTRELAQVNLAKSNQENEAKFRLDWHLAALPIVQEKTHEDPLYIFKRWLSHMIILHPVPSMIDGNSEEETLQPDRRGTDFGAWFSGLLAYAPSAYSRIDSYLKKVLPDITDIRNPLTGKASRSLEVQFSNAEEHVTVPFADLSDGEKCFLICATVLAAQAAYGPLVCFWDEPDNHLALSEVGHFVTELRKGFQSGGQFIATSHNPEAIRRFSEENTLLLYRRSHLEPTQVRPLDQVPYTGDLVDALIRDDVEP